MTIQFFGAVDRQGKLKTGTVRSEYPCWYHPARVDELAESINKDERMVKSGAIDNLPNSQEFRSELERKKVLLTEIEKDRPILTGKDKDRVANAYLNLQGQIANLMPSYTDMTKGLANAHEENRKDTTKCVNIEGFVDIARQCGVPVEKHTNTITRKQATRAWKIMGKALGEVSNVEYLRKDENTGTFKPERTIDQMIREDN